MKRLPLRFAGGRCQIIALLLLTLSPSLYAQTEKRGSSHAVTVTPDYEALVDLNFFADGKGLVLSPHLVNLYEFSQQSDLLWRIFSNQSRKRWGAISTEDRQLVGLQLEPYKGTTAGVLGCAVCHTGKAVGLFIPGLGNKNFDVSRAGQDYQKLFRIGDRFLDELLLPEERELRAAGRAYAEATSNVRVGNVTQGLVPTALVFGWFFKEAGKDIPPSMTAGSVKVPPLWGYEKKRAAGFFCDGMGDGHHLSWNVGVDLTAGQTPETIRAIYPRIEQSQRYFEELLPPPYPFAIDDSLVPRGKAVFRENCQACHGDYRRTAAGLPVFEEPRWIPIDRVATDSERLDIKTPELLHQIQTGPLSDVMGPKITDRGYFAPRLEGIWARYPYLHNASVPTLAHLLEPSETRPRTFSLVNAGEAYRFDPEKVGLTTKTAPLSSLIRSAAASAGRRSLYSTKRLGHSSQGHNFGVNLCDEDKRHLIEYLKTL